MIKYFHLYFYYRLYQWAEKREDHFPVILVLPWLGGAIYFHACTVLSLITIFFGVDYGRVLEPSGNRLFVTGQAVAWLFITWACLKVWHVKEKAFSPEVVLKYKEKGFKVWWLVVYFVLSYAAMAVTAWFAGARLRGQ